MHSFIYVLMGAAAVVTWSATAMVLFISVLYDVWPPASTYLLPLPLVAITLPGMLYRFTLGHRFAGLAQLVFAPFFAFLGIAGVTWLASLVNPVAPAGTGVMLALLLFAPFAWFNFKGLARVRSTPGPTTM